MFTPEAVIADAVREVRSKVNSDRYIERSIQVMKVLARRDPLAKTVYDFRRNRLMTTVQLVQPGLNREAVVMVWDSDVTSRLKFSFPYSAHKLVFGTRGIRRKPFEQLRFEIAEHEATLTTRPASSIDFDSLVHQFVEAQVVDEIADVVRGGGEEEVIRVLNSPPSSFDNQLLPPTLHFLFDDAYRAVRQRSLRKVTEFLNLEWDPKKIEGLLGNLQDPSALRRRLGMRPPAEPQELLAETLTSAAPYFAYRKAISAERNWDSDLNFWSQRFPAISGRSTSDFKIESFEETLFAAADALESSVMALRQEVALIPAKAVQIGL